MKVGLNLQCRDSRMLEAPVSRTCWGGKTLRSVTPAYTLPRFLYASTVSSVMPKLLQSSRPVDTQSSLLIRKHFSGRLQIMLLQANAISNFWSVLKFRATAKALVKPIDMPVDLQPVRSK